jgi:hypothetical protein
MILVYLEKSLKHLFFFTAIAELLAKHRDQLKKANILFVLFDNEAFDYGGSSRFANDLFLNKFPKININEKVDESGYFVLSKLTKKTCFYKVYLYEFFNLINIFRQRKHYNDDRTKPTRNSRFK